MFVRTISYYSRMFSYDIFIKNILFKIRVQTKTERNFDIQPQKSYSEKQQTNIHQRRSN